MVVGYAFSPIDTVPDFVPVVGYLDDLILLPIGIALASRIIPAPIMVESRAKAVIAESKPTNWIAAGAIVALWIALLAFGFWLIVF